MSFIENNYENAISELFSKHLGYKPLQGRNIKRDSTNPLYETALKESLKKINPHLSPNAINEALYKLRHFPTNNLLQVNKIFTHYLQNGIEVCYLEKGQEQYNIVHLIDYQNYQNNSFHLIRQWTVTYNNISKRLDAVVFVNGLPLVVIELKSCLQENTDISEAYRQIRNYIKEIPSLFYYNAFCVISDLVNSKAGTITASEDRFSDWKTIQGDYKETKHASFDTLFKGMFAKQRLLDIIKNFLLFSGKNNNTVKILSQYHQYFAVKKAMESTQKAMLTDGRAGIFWHTTGSGKSLSMVFYAKHLQYITNNPTIIVLTDRNDLDEQLFTTFTNCSSHLQQVPEQAKSHNHLKKLIENKKAGGIIFTTIQKFQESNSALSERKNIFIIADEAHRSHYTFEKKIDLKTGKSNVGYALLIRQAFPHATFIGFTGTPLETKKHNTTKVFGNYIDIYDITQSVSDGTTKPVYYENRIIKLELNEKILEKIDTTYSKMAKYADDIHIEKSKRALGKMNSIFSAPQTLAVLCKDIIAHYEQRADILTGKAMIVAYSRDVAMKIYKKILKLRPHWQEKLALVMTSSNNDPEDWKQIIGNKHKRKSLERSFKDNNSKIKIAIIVDMWLTGFDVPSLATMYVYKPMEGHNLIQAISRVNRAFNNKEGGLVVDYIGIANALKKAIENFTNRDKKNFGYLDIAKTAYPKFSRKLQICRELFTCFDYSPFLQGSDLDKAEAIKNGLNFIFSTEKSKEKYSQEALKLNHAYSLCRSMLTNEERMEYAFFEALRIGIIKITSSKKLSLKEINTSINKLLKQTINANVIINIFQDNTPKISIFDKRFLQQISTMKQTNLAVKLLQNSLMEQNNPYKKEHHIDNELFSQKFKKLIFCYQNKQISNLEVIATLLNIATELTTEQAKTSIVVLSAEEKAFYDAISQPKNLKDFFENKILIEMTKALTNELKNSCHIDWSKKEPTRAAIKMKIKRLLKKYQYPPEEIPLAVDALIKQCEQWPERAFT